MANTCDFEDCLCVLNFIVIGQYTIEIFQISQWMESTRMLQKSCIKVIPHLALRWFLSIALQWMM